MTRSMFGTAVACVAVAVIAAGCGSSGSGSAKTGSSGGSTTAPGALSAEAKSAASGDIPDNQVFVTLHDAAAGYSMRYPEGWVQRGAGSDVTLQDKNNLVRVAVRGGAAPSAARVATE